MNISYFISSIGILFFFGLFYYLIFKKDTFLNIKRALLLLIMIFACIFPWITTENNILLQNNSISGVFYAMNTINLEEVVITNNSVTTKDNLSIFSFLSGIWIGISCVLFIRLLIQINAVRLLKRGYQSYFHNKSVVIDINKELSPFSFFNWIFICKSKYTPNDLNRILKHELAHVRQLHSIDILFTELFCIIFWWNPVAWFIKKEVKINLEFLADREALFNEMDLKEYQYLLLKETIKNNLQVVNNFNITELKKRIIMMNKVKTTNLMLLKYFLAIPTLTLLLLMVSRSYSNASSLDKISHVNSVEEAVFAPKDTIEDKPAGKIFDYVETMPRFPGGEKAMYEFISKNLVYPVEAQATGKQGRVTVRFVISPTGKIGDVVIMRGTDPALDQAALNVVKTFPDWTPGEQNGKAVSVYYTVPIVFRLKENTTEKN